MTQDVWYGQVKFASLKGCGYTHETQTKRPMAMDCGVSHTYHGDQEKRGGRVRVSVSKRRTCSPIPSNSLEVHGTGWLFRHRGWADGGDTFAMILLNEDGSQNARDCGESRLCALTSVSTRAAALSCEWVLPAPTTVDGHECGFILNGRY